MPFSDEPVPYPQLCERQAGDGWQNFSDRHAVVIGPFKHRHRLPGMGQSDGRCGAGWSSPDYGDIKPFAHKCCVQGWRSRGVVSSRVAGTLPPTASSFIIQIERALVLDVSVCALLFHNDPQLGPILYHVATGMPTGRHPIKSLLATKDLVRSLAWPPVYIKPIIKAAGKEVSLPRYCHPCCQSARGEFRVDTEWAVPIISSFLEHDPADLNAWIEPAAHTRFQSGAVQSVGRLHIG